ncbi:MAG: tetraacyldisaccharide 4'-kinase [Rikenellaceae bacterium]
MLSYIFRLPLSWLFAAVVFVRHKMFNSGILKSTEFDIPIVCVGNLTVGGTGKTPTTEMLVGILSKYYKVAVLSRGYKRKTKGFVLSTPTTSFKKIGDEPKQIKLKFPTIPVAVCEKRVEGVEKLRELHPEVNLIILDDAFQHRYIEPWVNIVLMDYNNPIYSDKMLPVGRLRDLPSQIDRAQMVIVTKCPENVTPLDMRLITKNLDLLPFQHLFFTRVHSSPPSPLFPSAKNPTVHSGQPVIVFTAIAKPHQFIEQIEKNYTLAHKMVFADHYTFKMRDVEQLEQLLAQAPPETIVLITEKDAVKLIGSRRISEALRSKIFYINITHEFIGQGAKIGFERILLQYANENQKDNITYPQ